VETSRLAFTYGLVRERKFESKFAVGANTTLRVADEHNTPSGGL
jgi:hypothetical protein